MYFGEESVVVAFFLHNIGNINWFPRIRCTQRHNPDTEGILDLVTVTVVLVVTSDLGVDVKKQRHKSKKENDTLHTLGNLIDES